MTNKITILLVDKVPVVRCGIRAIVQDTDANIAIAEAGSASEAVSHVQSTPVDAVVMGIDLPGRDGLSTLHQMRKACSHPPPVLVFSNYPEREYGLRALRSGAAGFLAKTASPGEVVGAIRTILRGQRYVSRELADALAEHAGGGSERRPQDALSDREIQILRMLSSGQRNSQIASQLHLSVKTVQTHRTRILRKLELRTDTELATYAFKHKLIASRRQTVDEDTGGAAPPVP
jgi:DNA-binding NarL/FixJ family response regulator